MYSITCALEHLHSYVAKHTTVKTRSDGQDELELDARRRSYHLAGDAATSAINKMTYYKNNLGEDGLCPDIQSKFHSQGGYDDPGRRYSSSVAVAYDQDVLREAALNPRHRRLGQDGTPLTTHHANHVAEIYENGYAAAAKLATIPGGHWQTFKTLSNLLLENIPYKSKRKAASKARTFLKKSQRLSRRELVDLVKCN